MDTMSTILLGSVNAVNQVRRQDLQEIERLRERLGTVVMLLGSAKSALKGGRVIDAAEWINQAEQAAIRGGDR